MQVRIQWTKLIEIVIVRCSRCWLAFKPDKPIYWMLLWIVRIITITTTAAATAAFDFVKLCKLKFQSYSSGSSNSSKKKKEFKRVEKLFPSFCVIVRYSIFTRRNKLLCIFLQNVSMLFILHNDRFKASILIGFFFFFISRWIIQPLYIVRFSSAMRFKLNHLHPLYSNHFPRRRVRMFIKIAWKDDGRSEKKNRKSTSNIRCK